MTSGLYQFRCNLCGHQELTNLGGAVMRFRAVGYLRRAEPDAPMLAALAPEVAPQLACTQCGGLGLMFSSVDRSDLPHDDQPTRDAEAFDDVCWPNEVRRCEQCRQTIPPERIEVFPTTRLCARCQAASEESGGVGGFCPRCGGRLRIVTTTGERITRYTERCDECGYRSV